mgnify:CR=1 FL=1
MRPDDYLEQCADMYRLKHTMYGDNYRLVGKVMNNLFPDGITVKTVDDWNRLHLLFLSIVKITRYTNNFHNGGHDDSLLDNIVYLSMLQEIDRECLDKEVKETMEGK